MDIEDRNGEFSWRCMDTLEVLIVAYDDFNYHSPPGRGGDTPWPFSAPMISTSWVSSRLYWTRSPGKHRWSVKWLEIKENLGRIVDLSRRLREFNLAISSMVKLEREIEESSSKSLVLTASSSAFAA